MDEFIKKIILRRTIQAAFQRGKVYPDGLSQKARDELKNSIKEELVRISGKYVNEVSEEKHLKNIEVLSQTIIRKHKRKLKNGRLRIGTAQKLLNVFIKFLWCLGEAKEPEHCPIDRIVLTEIKSDHKWTDLQSIDEYKEVISEIRMHIDNESVARWEWKLWNRKA
ncbi:MAG: hypothetical protein KAW02_01910 [candidate division Zixibacteria bacterium]|nr:hypothetical protein [candidate division Zixibacteria bacterium]